MKALRWIQATPQLWRGLAEMNARLLEDEGHRNRDMPVSDLERRMRGWLESGEYEAVVFEIDGPVAYALFRRDGDEVFLRQLFVERECRRQGIGRAAVDLLVTEILGSPARVTLEVLSHNVAARHFWNAVGFRNYAVGMELVMRDAAEPRVAADRAAPDR